MSVLTYIPSFEDVRALLGVEDEELPDSRIGLKVFFWSLEEALGNIHVDLKQEYLDIVQIATASRSAAQARLFSTVQTYAAYHVAFDLCNALPQFSPKTISDGKAFVQRHADSPYKVTIDSLSKGLARALANLVEAYASVGGPTVTPATSKTILWVSSPSVDVVTNE